jgi:hypothetical protein
MIVAGVRAVHQLLFSNKQRKTGDDSASSALSSSSASSGALILIKAEMSGSGMRVVE